MSVLKQKFIPLAPHSNVVYCPLLAVAGDDGSDKIIIVIISDVSPLFP